MSLYPVTIRRCQHIKVNGTQCASPALRAERHCFYHMRFHRNSMEIKLDVSPKGHGIMILPILEDANSIQAGLAEILRLLATKQIDHRTAGLMLYALQTASSNLKHTSFEPEPTRVVIDRDCVERRPIGATAWSTVEGREYDDASEIKDGEGQDNSITRQLIEMLGLDPEAGEETNENDGASPGPS